MHEVQSEKRATPKKMNLEIDKEAEIKCEEEDEAQMDVKKTKKKKEKAKREICALNSQTIYVVHVFKRHLKKP